MAYYTVSVRLTEDEKFDLSAYCDANDITMSQLIRRLLNAFLAKQR